MPSPVFVIVGRPNVGKSTFFNRLIGRRAAIVQAEPGVTRDRRYGEGEWEGKKFLAVDTGGIATSGSDPFLPKIQEQTATAIEESDVVLFLVDGIEGLLPGDHEVAQMIRVSQKPVLLIVNKSDFQAHARDGMGFLPTGSWGSLARFGGAWIRRVRCDG